MRAISATSITQWTLASSIDLAVRSPKRSPLINDSCHFLELP